MLCPMMPQAGASWQISGKSTSSTKERLKLTISWRCQQNSRNEDWETSPLFFAKGSAIVGLFLTHPYTPHIRNHGRARTCIAKFVLHFSVRIVYYSIEKGVCFRTTLGSRFCGSFLCCIYTFLYSYFIQSVLYLCIPCANSVFASCRRSLILIRLLRGLILPVFLPIHEVRAELYKAENRVCFCSQQTFYG